jgi:uncharacterized coiled-coil protein SlyX
MNPIEERRKQRLLEMLTYKRPHESATESDFVTTYLLCPPYSTKAEIVGPMRNIVIVVGDGSSTMFSCHTDTVHLKDGRQEIQYDPVTDHVFKKDGECLGADDTTGVWLMLEMIDAGVPGTYVFHRGEERGGIGSSWLAKNKADWLKTFKRAVAFDRKGEESVITMQRGRKCCSDEFAKALAEKLGADWRPDPSGTFTDTANFIAHIPECTNLSIGYYDQHTSNETQNVEFAMELCEKVIALDWESLPTVREAKDELPVWQGRSGLYGGYGGADDDWDDWQSWRRQKAKPIAPVTPLKPAPAASKNRIDEQDKADYDKWSEKDLISLPLSRLIAVCREDPVYAAVKIVELCDGQTIQHNLFEELSDHIAELELEIEALEDRVESLKSDYADLEKEYNALGRRRQFKLPFFGRSQEGSRR